MKNNIYLLSLQATAKQSFSMRATAKQTLLLFSLFIFHFSFSQNILWEKSFGGDKVEYLFDAIPTKDYGFILAGSSLSSAKGDVSQENQGNYDYWIWKMNEQGNQVWQKSLAETAMIC
jgi:hypothetical protein